MSYEQWVAWRKVLRNVDAGYTVEKLTDEDREQIRITTISREEALKRVRIYGPRTATAESGSGLSSG